MSRRYTLVDGDPHAHKAEVVDLLNRNLIPSREEVLARYTKYYETNPDGPPLLVLARESTTGRYVGTCAIFPTRLSIAEESVLGGVSGDFAVDADHRGFGPALAIQRALLARLGERGLSYLYGVPNPFSEAITRRVGYRDLGRITRFVKVFRLGVVIERHVSRPGLARVAAGVSSFTADPLLSLASRDRFARRSKRFSVERPSAFDERFAGLWEAARRQGRITSHRDTASMNWRFDKPDIGGTNRHPLVAVFAGDRAVGYVVYRTSGGVCDVLDVSAVPSREVVDTLLSAFVADARRGGVAAIDIRYFGPRSLLTRRLRAFGFLALEHSDGLCVFVEDGAAREQELTAPGNWCLFESAQDI